MPRKSTRYLQHIHDSACYILDVGAGQTEDAYNHNRMLRQAIERNYEIIGEAAARLQRIDPDLATRISHHRQIVAFRNVLIHGYDTIDADQVLRVIRQDLPRLRDEVQALLTDLS